MEFLEIHWAPCKYHSTHNPSCNPSVYKNIKVLKSDTVTVLWHHYSVFCKGEITHRIAGILFSLCRPLCNKSIAASQLSREKTFVRKEMARHKAKESGNVFLISTPPGALRWPLVIRDALEYVQNTSGWPWHVLHHAVSVYSRGVESSGVDDTTGCVITNYTPSSDTELPLAVVSMFEQSALIRHSCDTHNFYSSTKCCTSRSIQCMPSLRVSICGISSTTCYRDKVTHAGES